mmetsp:Transcript_2031/g.5807  ORF Transcript_2031/g.5807 Transcript_2031/m.5807 type:complete len:203 (-) Transcript_2031:238-846(-)
MAAEGVDEGRKPTEKRRDLPGRHGQCSLHARAPVRKDLLNGAHGEHDSEVDDAREGKEARVPQTRQILHKTQRHGDAYAEDDDHQGRLGDDVKQGPSTRGAADHAGKAGDQVPQHDEVHHQGAKRVEEDDHGYEVQGEGVALPHREGTKLPVVVCATEGRCPLQQPQRVEGSYGKGHDEQDTAHKAIPLGRIGETQHAGAEH